MDNTHARGEPPRRHSQKNAIFWVVWLVLWILTWLPPVFTAINDSHRWSLGTHSPIMLWTIGLIIAQIVVIWVNFAVENRSGELSDDVEAIDWSWYRGKPELSMIYSDVQGALKS